MGLGLIIEENGVCYQERESYINKGKHYNYSSYYEITEVGVLMYEMVHGHHIRDTPETVITIDDFEKEWTRITDD